MGVFIIFLIMFIIGIFILLYNDDSLIGLSCAIKKYQKNFWIGAFIPNIYDEFELIEVSE